MSRSVQWRHSVSDACNWHQAQALESTIYILRQTGPTGFLLKEEGENKNVKVFLGDPHTCTCPVFKRERDLCKHICWLLLRKFRLSVNDPLSWQLGLVEREVNEILRGRVTADERRVRNQPKKSKVLEVSDGRDVVEQRKIDDEDVCPICQEELLSKKLPVTYCKFGCGNSIHIKCMKVWAEHQQKSTSDGKIKCPMCREDFGPVNLLKTEMRNAGCSAEPAPGVRMDRHLGIACSHCSKAPIEGKCYRCTVCPTFHMCQRCFNLPVHTTHSFQFRHKRNQRWRSAPRTLGSGLPPALVNDLMHREISENDYDMLLQLERNGEAELSSLTEDSLQSIPIERVRDGGPLLAPGSQCRVCLRGFVVGQFVRKLPCKHRFHKDCIDSWLLHSHPTCPIDGLAALVGNPTVQNTNGSSVPERSSSNDDTPNGIQVPDTLTLTAFGIPVASSRLSERQTNGTGGHSRNPALRTRPNFPSTAGLELSGMRVGTETAVSGSPQVERNTERVPGQGLLQQAMQHRDRISQQLRNLHEELTSPPTADQFLTPGALIELLQAGPMTSDLDDGALMERRPSAGSVTSAASDRGPRSTGRAGMRGHGRHTGTRTYLRQRANSLERAVPSIQPVRGQPMFRAEEFSSGRESLQWSDSLPDENSSALNMGRSDTIRAGTQRGFGDLFLGNDPQTQAAVTEEVTVAQRPPVVPRSRPRVLRSVFHKRLNNTENSSNRNISLEGSAIENNNDDD